MSSVRLVDSPPNHVTRFFHSRNWTTLARLSPTASAVHRLLITWIQLHSLSLDHSCSSPVVVLRTRLSEVSEADRSTLQWLCSRSFCFSLEASCEAPYSLTWKTRRQKAKSSGGNSRIGCSFVDFREMVGFDDRENIQHRQNSSSGPQLGYGLRSRLAITTTWDVRQTSRKRNTRTINYIYILHIYYIFIYETVCKCLGLILTVALTHRCKYVRHTCLQSQSLKAQVNTWTIEARGRFSRRQRLSQISLTIPIANVAAERSFSTLRQIRTNTRVEQCRRLSLAVLLIFPLKETLRKLYRVDIENLVNLLHVCQAFKLRRSIFQAAPTLD